jgi:uncharacterized protein (DUF779 family)
MNYPKRDYIGNDREMTIGRVGQLVWWKLEKYRYWILDGRPILDTGYWMLDGRPILDAG